MFAVCAFGRICQGVDPLDAFASRRKLSRSLRLQNCVLFFFFPRRAGDVAVRISRMCGLWTGGSRLGREAESGDAD